MYRKPDNTESLQSPLKLCVAYLKENKKLRVHLTHNKKFWIEGEMIGFDEFMNFVLKDAVEFYPKTGNIVNIGTICLRGENIAITYPIK